MTFIELIYLITACILFLTFLAVVYYACETQKLRKATVEHNELQLRPCVTVFWESGFKFKNIGQSTALNITVRDIEIGKHIYRFERLGLLMPNQTTIFEFVTVGKDDPVGTKYKREYSLRLIKAKEFFIEIIYENMENKQYFSKLKIYPLAEKSEFLETDKTK